ncbi:MAG: HAD-IC family P-type ATPase, partial [Planctomycetes bacterium]|nr:HAD-IC family P-type ATPase [Planctomycetota bacterium]
RLVAALVAVLLGDWEDGLFIGAVLLLNAVIGTIQEYNAQRSAAALASLTVPRALVVRDGEELEIDARHLVEGDIVLLETGNLVPADLRLITANGLQVDESLLTGESKAVNKHPQAIVDADAGMGDRVNMAFAGTLVQRGRGRGVCVATGLNTQLGAIAEAVLGREGARPPLLLRMETFTRKLTVLIGVACALVAAVALARGQSAQEVFVLAVALAVAAIPEGLPVALTVALAIAVRRMSRRRVIVRKLAAVEALGSCTYIASDKTGTLTMNQLTAERLWLPGLPLLRLSGQGVNPAGELVIPPDTDTLAARALAERLARAVALCNEATLALKGQTWVTHGDAVDVSLLVVAHKLGITRPALEAHHPLLASVPFESERQYAATLHGPGALACVKGALEKLLPMCASMAAPGADTPLDRQAVEAAARELADQGYRVMAVADGRVNADADSFGPDRLAGLCFLGLVGTIDPLRPDAPAAIAACGRAGVAVAMVTGDHPVTALAIARKLGLASDAAEVVTGPQLASAPDDSARAALVRQARVFARVEPRQKLEIVQALQAQGHFVAVTGDGANDAPALRQANVGVAMGKSGTDVARETADLIITDDAFGSIVAGIEEGRVAYANVRKVIFLLISTGAGTILAFITCLALGLPMLFVATQLLWLNLVTNGIQDVALAFEPAEGNELSRRPRPPKEPIFNRRMIESVLVSALWIGTVCAGAFWWLLDRGASEFEARNSVLLLMVFFQNIQVGNARSESESGFLISPLRNPLLLAGTALAQLVHIGAMFTPGLNRVLQIAPVSATEYGLWLVAALSLFLVLEAYKLVRRLRPL